MSELVELVLANPMPLLIVALAGALYSMYLLGTDHGSTPMPIICEREHVEITVDPYENVPHEHAEDQALVEQMQNHLQLEPVLSTDERVDIVAQTLWLIGRRPGITATSWAKLRSKRERERWQNEARQMLARLHQVE